MGSLFFGDITEDRRQLDCVCSADAIEQRFALGCFLTLQRLPLPLGTPFSGSGLCSGGSRTAFWAHGEA